MANILVKIIIIAINFANIRAQCTTIVTDGGTQTPELCKFPFTFQGQVFENCTTFSDNDNLEWCSVETDQQGNHVRGQGKWGHCDPAKCLNNNINPVTINNTQERCLTVI